MTVTELRKQLQQIERGSCNGGDRLVIIDKDDDASPLDSMGTCAYRAETTWCGDVGLEELTPESIKEGLCEEDVISNGVPALLLRPVN